MKQNGKVMKCDNPRCLYDWIYRGESIKVGQYVTCPKCKKCVKIKDNESVGGKK